MANICKGNQIVLVESLTLESALEDFQLSLRSQLAREAFSTALMAEEAADLVDDFAQIYAVIKNHQRSRAQRYTVNS